MACKLVGAIALVVAAAHAQTNYRINVSASGAQANNESDGAVALTPDGHWAAFRSYASNLVAGDTTGSWDIFVRDLTSTAIERVSIDSNGVPANFTCYDVALSSDARYVVFSTAASNLVAGDTNALVDVFLRDRQAATTTRVSVSSAGAQSNGTSEQPAISADGRFVVFASSATNLVVGDTNGVRDAFVRDLQAGTTQRVSVDSAGVQGNAKVSDWPVLSGDGRFVGFHSAASNLVAGDTNAGDDVFVHDRTTHTTERVSVSSTGAQAAGNSAGASFSYDGRYVAFSSTASDLVSGDTNGHSDIFVHDRQTGATERISVGSHGEQGSEDSALASLSSDGRHVSFWSLASELVSGDTNNSGDIFVHDRATRRTERVNVTASGGQANNITVHGLRQISANGRFVVFMSWASNLVAGDTNFYADVFLRDRGPLFVGAYCTAGTTSNGCVASLAASGVPSTSAGAGFTLTVDSVEGQRQGLVFYGVDNFGFAASAWGASSSHLCVKPPLQRSMPQFSGGTDNACDGALTLDWNAFIAANPSALGQPFVVGQSVFAQAWFRDPPSPKTTQLSDAFEFIVGP